MSGILSERIREDQVKAQAELARQAAASAERVQEQTKQQTDHIAAVTKKFRRESTRVFSLVISTSRSKASL